MKICNHKKIKTGKKKKKFQKNKQDKDKKINLKKTKIGMKCKIKNVVFNKQNDIMDKKKNQLYSLISFATAANFSGDRLIKIIFKPRAAN